MVSTITASGMRDSPWVLGMGSGDRRVFDPTLRRGSRLDWGDVAGWFAGLDRRGRAQARHAHPRLSRPHRNRDRYWRGGELHWDPRPRNTGAGKQPAGAAGWRRKPAE